MARKQMALDHTDLIGSIDDLPSDPKPLLFNFKAKQIALPMWVALNDAESFDEIAKVFAEIALTIQLVELDEAISNGRRRSKPAGSAKPKSEARARMEAELARIDRDLAADEEKIRELADEYADELEANEAD